MEDGLLGIVLDQVKRRLIVTVPDESQVWEGLYESSDELILFTRH